MQPKYLLFLHLSSMSLKHENENNVRQVPHGCILQAVALGKFSSAFARFGFMHQRYEGLESVCTSIK